MPAFSQLFEDPLAAIGYGLLTSGQNPVGAAMGVMQQAEQNKAAREQAEFQKLMMQYKMEQAMNPKPTTAVLPSGDIALVQGRAGTYTIARPEGQMPTQQAAPVTGGIQTRNLPAPSQYDMDLGATIRDSSPQAVAGNMPSIDDLVTAGRGGAQLPAQIPDTQIGKPSVKQLPRPIPTGNMAADQKALQDWQAANLRLQEQAAGVLSPKEQIEVKDSFGKANLSLKEAKRTSQNMTKAAQEALKLLKSGQAGGWKSALGSRVPESSARSLENQVSTIKANTLVKALNNMRAASPTGGAVGALSDKEGALLAALEGPLDTSDPQGLEETLNTIIRLAPEVLAEREAALGAQFPDLYKPQQAGNAQGADNDPLGIR